MRKLSLRSGCVAALLALAGTAHAVPGKIVIRNLDAAGEGFNSTVAIAPVGGNPGTTVGQQRLNLFQYAANIWGTILQNTDTIYVNANFDSLTCTVSSAVLGSAGPRYTLRDFTNAPFSGTWYHIALANQLAGSRLLAPGTYGLGEITARFNSELDGDPACLGGKTWYYGYDGNEGTLIELLPVVLHELGHGLGFSTTTNGQTGVWSGTPTAYPSAFDHFLYDSLTHKNWSDPTETNANRAASAIGVNKLLWNGAAVMYGAAHLPLTAGSDASWRPLMYSPASYSSGSSVSHFDVTLTPNVLMEPALNASLSSDVDLTKHAFVDLGWLPLTTPTALARFTAEDFESGILLVWDFTDRSGIVSVTVERATSDAGPWTALDAEIFTRDGHTAALDQSVEAGQSYWYRLRVLDDTQGESVYGMTSAQHAAVADAPVAFRAPSPNPTRTGTTLAFRLPRPEYVRVDVVDATGRRMATLQDGMLLAGDYQRWWDGTVDGAPVAPGLYFATLRTSQGRFAQRVAVVR